MRANNVNTVIEELFAFLHGGRHPESQADRSPFVIPSIPQHDRRAKKIRGWHNLAANELRVFHIVSANHVVRVSQTILIYTAGGKQQSRVFPATTGEHVAP